MMKTKTNLYLLLASVALLALPAAGCGDSTECGPGTVKLGEKCVADQAIDETPDDLLECGAGTVEADGACVPDGSGADTQCGPKTTLQDGQCVIAADACEAGEMLDPNSGQCVAGGNGGSACGAGTALDAGSDTCIPTEDVCDSGTIFDAASGLCLPDACQVGDVLLAGICVSPAQELAAQADVEESENNDPAQGGSSNALTLKDVGESTIFTGTIGEDGALANVLKRQRIARSTLGGVVILALFDVGLRGEFLRGAHADASQQDVADLAGVRQAQARGGVEDGAAVADIFGGDAGVRAGVERGARTACAATIAACDALAAVGVEHFSRLTGIRGDHALAVLQSRLGPALGVRARAVGHAGAVGLNGAHAAFEQVVGCLVDGLIGHTFLAELHGSRAAFGAIAATCRRQRKQGNRCKKKV